MIGQEHILVVEDDASLSEWICDYLLEHGFQVTVANRGDSAIELIEADNPDLVLLDIMLPEKNGFEVCQEVRKFYPSPILMMTACSEENDEIMGLELGADDYIHKPVKPKRLLARIRALLRRNQIQDAYDHSNMNQRQFGSLTVDASARTVKLDDTPISFSSNEFDVLWLLVKNAGQVVNRTELISQLRGIEYDGFDRSIDIRISRIRKKLNDNSQHPDKIKTIWGKGYLFAEDAW